MTRRVGIFVFDNVEVLDFAGPYEVFTCATRVARKHGQATENLFEVFTVGEKQATLHARAGLSVHPDYVFNQHPDIDLLIVPGGVVDAEQAKFDVIDWIQKTAARSTLTASVCTGAFLLAQAGLLVGKQVTTHWEDIADLRHQFPRLEVIEHVRWVDQGDVITSGGISAGIDMSLHIVERVAGRELAELTARQMEFDWQENPQG